MTKIYDAANWSKHEDDFTQMFYNQNVKQFWLPEEIALNGDLLTWKYLGKNEQDTYMKVLAGLTLLDTEQGNTGMPIVAEHVDGHQRKAVLNFMAMMENAVHAKSYSNIFMTPHRLKPSMKYSSGSNKINICRKSANHRRTLQSHSKR